MKKSLSLAQQKALREYFAFNWAVAVLTEDRTKRRFLLSPMAACSLVAKGKNGHGKLELSKTGEAVMTAFKEPT